MKTILTLLLLIVIHSLWWITGVHFNWVSFKEYGGLENTQAMYNLIGCILFIKVSLLRERKEERLLFTVLSFLCLTFFIREIEVSDIRGAHPFFIWLLDGTGFIIWQAISWGTLFMFILKSWRGFMTRSWKWLKTNAGYPILLAGALLLATTPIDKKDFKISVDTAKLIEEMIEINAFLLIVLCAVISLRLKQDLSEEVSSKAIFGCLLALALMVAIFSSYPPFFLNLFK